ncbi:MAG: hypothetical protein DLM73_09140 [Chthoniobacterales bacterium]|nr:MAG: hypothetical protein DLM73_09140 [Chthoniobacterales bacterium]
MARSRSSNNNSAAQIGLEAKPWLAADKLRSNTDAAEYKHVIPICSQDKPTRGKRRVGLANRARRLRLMGNQPKQSNATTRRLAMMNLAIRGIEADLSEEQADTFRRDLRADYVLANPPFSPCNAR